MKTQYLITASFLSVFLLFNCFFISASDPVSYYTISGKVKDKKNKKKIEYVNVYAVGTNIGTITNEDGEFQLKLDNALRISEIELSALGYYNNRVSISNSDLLNQTFYLTPQSFQLSEVEVFSWQNPRDLVKAAIEKIDVNYSLNPNLLTGFYRETIQKGRRYINISEAVVQVYKNPYDKNIKRDRVQVLKGRKLISPKPNDTLNVKLLGGPNMAVEVDIVKNPDILLDEESLQFYRYRMGETTSINDRLQYVVHFEPQVIASIPLFKGTFYIDRETLAFTRAEFGFDMKDKKKVTEIILKEKPKGLRFSPEDVSYVVTYKQHNNKTYFNYLRTEIKFKCDWKRRLFATTYTVIGETVITDNQEENAIQIASKDSFKKRQSLSDEAMTFYDENFWGGYNIIEPTESLENAVNKLRKEQSKNQ